MLLRNVSRAQFHNAVLLIAFASTLTAAPRLNLAQTALVLSVVPGSNGPQQSVDTSNTGDGTLSLQVSSSVSWLVPSIGASHTCVSGSGSCIPVLIAVQSSSLAQGTYTGTVTVSAPNALDSPQTITVTVFVGGDVPSTLTFYVPPGGSASSSFTTAGKPTQTSVSSNAPWLSIAVNGSGTFQFNVPYQITAAAASGMTPSDYNGTVTISGSSFAPDNKQVSVSMNVTTQPILQASPNPIQILIAQGANKQTSTNGTLPYISVSNTGLGTLNVVSATAATTSGANWLSAQISSSANSLIAIAADPTGLPAGVYQGTITIASNAANNNFVVPVQLTVQAQSPPLAVAGGVLNNGTFAAGESISPGDVVAVFGSQFTYGDPQSAASIPLLANLGGTQVLVNGEPASLYYVSPNQINFEVPADASSGAGNVQISRNGQLGNQVYVNIASSVPRFILLSGGPYVIMTTPAGALTGIPSHPVTANDVIVIYTIGLGPTAPAVASGVASPSNPPGMAPTTFVCFGVSTPFAQVPCVKAQFSGLSPGLVGLYQVNVQIPSGLTAGSMPFYFTVGGVSSDIEQIAIQ